MSASDNIRVAKTDYYIEKYNDALGEDKKRRNHVRLAIELDDERKQLNSMLSEYDELFLDD